MHGRNNEADRIDAANDGCRIWFYVSWFALLYSLSLTGMGYQNGWTPFYYWLRQQQPPRREFKPRGAYKLIRHPVYLSFLGLVWFTPRMTLDHAALTAIWTGYIFYGSFLKDRRLEGFIGESYKRYESEVPGFPLGRWVAATRQTAVAAGRSPVENWRQRIITTLRRGLRRAGWLEVIKPTERERTNHHKSRKRFVLIVLYGIVLLPWIVPAAYRAMQSNANSPLDWVGDDFAPRHQYDQFCSDSISATLVVFGVSLVCQLVTMAMVDLSGGTMTALLVVLPPLVQVLAMAGGIHFVNYYVEASEGAEQSTALSRAFQLAWLPCVLSAVTTAIGLGSLGVSGLVAVRDFAMYAAFGVLITVVILLSSLRGFFQWLWLPRPHSQPAARSRELWSHLGRWQQRNWGWVGDRGVAEDTVAAARAIASDGFGQFAFSCPSPWPVTPIDGANRETCRQLKSSFAPRNHVNPIFCGAKCDTYSPHEPYFRELTCLRRSGFAAMSRTSCVDASRRREASCRWAAADFSDSH